MLFSELGRDTSQTCIMFEYLSESAKEKVLIFKNASSHYDLNFDILPLAQLPYGTVAEFTQDELDMQALTQIGYFRGLEAF
ncbi:MAG: hypothetical protein U9P71_08110 [Campylobacterota bacterium]|nr:hypothetical protein [Campylobacterota bacterium]